MRIWLASITVVVRKCRLEEKMGLLLSKVQILEIFESADAAF